MIRISLQDRLHLRKAVRSLCEKALFGRIANAIRKGRAAKKAGKSFGEVAKAAGTGALTGSVGLAATGIKSLRSSKEKRQERREARRERDVLTVRQ